ncbi:polyadenylate-binding protein-interacting protein 2B isoform X2 [Aethina tumida]|nr:polyadenylate-binding protein-interacting protein 2B isoform X2 [Aethina tumida]
MSMKMPGSHANDNGIYDYEENSYFSETIENTGVEEFNAQEDFSEYLWMENEEEFDKEVMQRLEEEALMEQCIEAMLDDENSERTTPSSATQESTNEVANLINNLKLDNVDVKGSNLNPLAAEFVPGGTTPNKTTSTETAPKVSS